MVARLQVGYCYFVWSPKIIAFLKVEGCVCGEFQIMDVYTRVNWELNYIIVVSPVVFCLLTSSLLV
jgi:hypothetical protein